MRALGPPPARSPRLLAPPSPPSPLGRGNGAERLLFLEVTIAAAADAAGGGSGGGGGGRGVRATVVLKAVDAGLLEQFLKLVQGLLLSAVTLVRTDVGGGGGGGGGACGNVPVGAAGTAAAAVSPLPSLSSPRGGLAAAAPTRVPAAIGATAVPVEGFGGGAGMTVLDSPPSSPGAQGGSAAAPVVAAAPAPAGPPVPKTNLDAWLDDDSD